MCTVHCLWDLKKCFILAKPYFEENNTICYIKQKLISLVILEDVRCKFLRKDEKRIALRPSTNIIYLCLHCVYNYFAECRQASLYCEYCGELIK